MQRAAGRIVWPLSARAKADSGSKTDTRWPHFEFYPAARWRVRDLGLGAERDDGVARWAILASHMEDAQDHDAQVGADEQAEDKDGEDDPEHLCSHGCGLLQRTIDIVMMIIHLFA